MSRKRSADRIIEVLREAELLISQGRTTGDACRDLGISEESYARWLQEQGDPRADLARQPVEAPGAYFAPHGGMPAQSALMTGRAVFTEAYAVIPRGVFRDIVASRLPGWRETRSWIVARPLSGFAETFAQLVMEVAPGGGSDRPEPDREAEGAIFVTHGALTVALDPEIHRLDPGGFAYLPPRAAWTVENAGVRPARFHWIRKRY